MFSPLLRRIAAVAVAAPALVVMAAATASATVQPVTGAYYHQPLTGAYYHAAGSAAGPEGAITLGTTSAGVTDGAGNSLAFHHDHGAAAGHRGAVVGSTTSIAGHSNPVWYGRTPEVSRGRYRTVVPTDPCSCAVAPVTRPAAPTYRLQRQTDRPARDTVIPADARTSTAPAEFTRRVSVPDRPVRTTNADTFGRTARHTYVPVRTIDYDPDASFAAEHNHYVSATHDSADVADMTSAAGDDGDGSAAMFTGSRVHAGRDGAWVGAATSEAGERDYR